MEKKITSPISPDVVESLKAELPGIHQRRHPVGRDAAHKRLVESLDKGEKLPFDIKGQTIYYMGPRRPSPDMSSAPQGPPPAAAWMPIHRDFLQPVSKQ